MMSVKVDTLGLIEIYIVLKKGYGVIISVYDVTLLKLYCRCGCVTKAW